MPQLQEASGCDGDAPGLLARIGPFEFVNCPVRYLDAELQGYVSEFVAVRSGRCQPPTFADRRMMDARHAEAYDLLFRLVPRSDDGDH